MAIPSSAPHDTASFAQTRIASFAAGGEGVGRLDDDKVVFCAATVPGDLVSVRLTKNKKRWARASLETVIEAGPDRVSPRCSAVAAGCGGCDWQHVDTSSQPGYKAQIALDALTRLGGVADAAVNTDEAIGGWGYRTTLRVLGSSNGVGFRARASHDVVVPDECVIAHPALVDLMDHLVVPKGTEAVLRVSVTTGQRIVFASPSSEGVVAPDDVVVCDPETAAQTSLTETIAGVPFVVSAASFFQARPDGAERLAAIVGAAVPDAPPGRFVDLYAGVGLFSVLCARERSVTAVEVAASSVADARVNLAGRDAAVIEADVERWEPEPAAVVVADPPRRGLGAAGADVIAGTGAGRVVLVSCDAAAMGRDVGLLVERGYAWKSSTLVDLFPQTSHLEVVTVLDAQA